MHGKRKISVGFGVGVIIAAGFFSGERLSGGERNMILAAANRPVDESHRAIDSKLKLLGKLVNDSTAAKRITASTNEQALELLANAREAWQHATAARESGDLNASEQHVKQGLDTISAASRMVEDVGRVQLMQQQRYQQLRKRVLSFSEAFQRAVAEKPGQSVGDYLDQPGVSGLMLEAEGLAHKGDYVAANRRLVQAADAVEQALSLARDKETLVHELKFDSPEDEYAYEIQRNKGYQQLIDLLKHKRTGSDTKLVYVQKMVVENDRLCEEAEVLVKQGDVQAAIRELEKGTVKLERALRASGFAF
ncbi:MAG: hypothetical protein ABF290_00585 [Thiogranum sp.]